MSSVASPWQVLGLGKCSIHTIAICRCLLRRNAPELISKCTLSIISDPLHQICHLPSSEDARHAPHSSVNPGLDCTGPTPHHAELPFFVPPGRPLPLASRRSAGAGLTRAVRLITRAGCRRLPASTGHSPDVCASTSCLSPAGRGRALLQALCQVPRQPATHATLMSWHGVRITHIRHIQYKKSEVLPAEANTVEQPGPVILSFCFETFRSLSVVSANIARKSCSSACLRAYEPALSRCCTYYWARSWPSSSSSCSSPRGSLSWNGPRLPMTLTLTLSVGRAFSVDTCCESYLVRWTKLSAFDRQYSSGLLVFPKSSSLFNFSYLRSPFHTPTSGRATLR